MDTVASTIAPDIRGPIITGPIIMDMGEDSMEEVDSVGEDSVEDSVADTTPTGVESRRQS